MHSFCDDISKGFGKTLPISGWLSRDSMLDMLFIAFWFLDR